MEKTESNTYKTQMNHQFFRELKQILRKVFEIFQQFCPKLQILRMN